MGDSLTMKILREHLVSAPDPLKPGDEILIRIDQTLTQDATGTMAYLQFEAMGIPRVRTRLSVSYVDHNTLQTGYENMDDHVFLQTFAAKYGISGRCSRPSPGMGSWLTSSRRAPVSSRPPAGLASEWDKPRSRAE